MPEKIDILSTQLSPKQKQNLLAIYEDYLYFSRQLENMVKISTMRVLAQWQTDVLYKDNTQPKFPWKVTFLTKDEKEQYQSFTADKPQNGKGVGYISLQHTNPQKNNADPISWFPENYRMINMDMDLPNVVERYIITYPEDGKIGQTPFLVDGKYKVFYTSQEDENVSIKDIFNNPKIQTEFRILFNIIDYYEQNKYLLSKGTLPGMYEFFAAETVAPFENSILEVLGNFAEETQKISRRIYGNNDPLGQAQADNFIPSAKDFEDYIHIRHLMRHQWDTMDELGTFNEVLAERNKQKRAIYQASYNRVCDKPLKQRIESYVKILNQLQSVVKRIYPEILIRDQEESNSKFVERIKTYHRTYPQKDITVVANYPFFDNKRQALLKNIQKVLQKTGTNLNVIDEFTPLPERFRKIEEDYRRRSWFLNVYNNLECQMMTYCLTRGHNVKNKEAWEYFYKNKMISGSKIKVWRDYRQLRNELSHNHYNLALREQVRAVEDDFLNNVVEVETMIGKLYPHTTLIKGNIYECSHPDGKKVVLNFRTHEIIDAKNNRKISSKKEKTTSVAARRIEKFENGVEITLADEKVISFKMPNGIDINLEKQRIHFSKDVKFYNNAQNFSVLQTENSKILTDKRFKISDFIEKGKSKKVRRNDMFMIDYKHRFATNDMGQIKDFVVNTDQQKITVRFCAKDNRAEIILPDNIRVRMEKDQMDIVQNGKVLDYGNYKEFATAYDQNAVQTVKSSKYGFNRE